VVHEEGHDITETILEMPTKIFSYFSSLGVSISHFFSSRESPDHSKQDHSEESDIRDFVESVYRDALPSAKLSLNQSYIINWCVSRFQVSGYLTKSRLLDDCESIHNDDLGLKENKKIPLQLVNSIYRTIQDLKKDSPNAAKAPVPNAITQPIYSNFLLCLSKKDVKISSGKSFIVNGKYTANKGASEICVKVKVVSMDDIDILKHEITILECLHEPAQSEYFVNIVHTTLVTSKDFTVTEWADSDKERLQYTNHVGLVLERGIWTSIFESWPSARYCYSSRPYCESCSRKGYSFNGFERIQCHALRM